MSFTCTVLINRLSQVASTLTNQPFPDKKNTSWFICVNTNRKRLTVTLQSSRVIGSRLGWVGDVWMESCRNMKSVSVVLHVRNTNARVSFQETQLQGSAELLDTANNHQHLLSSLFAGREGEKNHRNQECHHHPAGGRKGGRAIMENERRQRGRERWEGENESDRGLRWEE